MGALRREHDGCVLDDHGYDVEQPDRHADPVRAYCYERGHLAGPSLPTGDRRSRGLGGGLGGDPMAYARLGPRRRRRPQRVVGQGRRARTAYLRTDDVSLAAVTEISFGTRLPRVGVSGGLTSLDYRAHGVTIPRDADAQVVKGKAVSRTALGTALAGFLLVAG